MAENLQIITDLKDVCECSVAQSCPTLCNPMGCSLPGFSFLPWDFPGENTGMDCHFQFQGIFPDQGSNLCLLHRPVDSSPLSHQESDLKDTTGKTNYSIQRPHLRDKTVKEHKETTTSKIRAVVNFVGDCHHKGTGRWLVKSYFLTCEVVEHYNSLHYIICFVWLFVFVIYSKEFCCCCCCFKRNH